MTFQQFLDKWDKKGINYDGAYGNQCVDVYDQYCKEVVGCRVILVNGAKDIWNNYPTEAFTKIPNTPAGVPQKGDVMIWGTGVGPYGHVGIVVSATVNSFTSFDQNWPFDDGKGVAHFQWHNYNGVLGWLRPRKDINFDQVAYEAEQKRLADLKAKAEAKKLADEKAKAEAERLAKIAAEKKEADRIAKEQARLEEEFRIAKEAAERLNKEKEMSERFSLNKEDLFKIGKGALIALVGALGAYLLTLVNVVDAGVYTPFVAGGLSVIANALIKYASGK